MQIDMNLATVEWLETWIAENTVKWPSARYISLDVNTAQRMYLRENVDVYIQNIQINSSSVILHMSTVDKADLALLMDLEFILPEGTVGFYNIASVSYNEPFCEDPSTRLEVKFQND